jgi:hypothetical protein
MQLSKLEPAPQARIISIKALDDLGSGGYTDMQNAINSAAELKVNIIVLTSGAPEGDAGVTAAIQDCLQKGILIVASAGNESSDTINFPANVNGVVAVGTTDASGAVVAFSSYGGKVIFTPGNRVSFIGLAGKKVNGSGTCYSAAVAGGIFAVLWSQNPGLSGQQLVNLVRDNAVSIKDLKGNPAKRIDAQAGLNAITKPQPTTHSVKGMHFNYAYSSGAFIRSMSGTVENPQGLWDALRPLQPQDGARGGYGLIGDDGLLGKEPGFGLRQLGAVARKFLKVETSHVEQPGGWETIGVQSGTFERLDDLNDTTLGWVFFDLRGKFEADLKQFLKLTP